MLIETSDIILVMLASYNTVLLIEKKCLENTNFQMGRYIFP